MPLVISFEQTKKKKTKQLNSIKGFYEKPTPIQQFYHEIIDKDEILLNKCLMGSGLREWNPENISWVTKLVGKKNSIINYEKLVMALRKAIYFLVLCFKKFRSSELLFVMNNFWLSDNEYENYSNRLKRESLVIYLKTNRIPYMQRWLIGQIDNRTHCRDKFNKLYMNDPIQSKLIKKFFKNPTCVVLLGGLDVGVGPASVIELRRAFIPTIALLDTPSSTQFVTYPIFSNDDSMLSILYFVRLFIKTTQYGRALRTYSINAHLRINEK